MGGMKDDDFPIPSSIVIMVHAARRNREEASEGLLAGAQTLL